MDMDEDWDIVLPPDEDTSVPPKNDSSINSEPNESNSLIFALK